MMTNEYMLNDVDTELIRAFGDSISYSFRLSDKTREVYCREASLFLTFLNKNNILIENVNPSLIESYIIEREEK